MSVQIKGSNSLEQLATQLSADLNRQQNHVFQPQYIITQTQGMNNWLKIKIAGNLGIMANCKFLRPNDFVYEVYNTICANNRQAFYSNSIQWVVFTLLSTKEFQDAFRKIANYYTNDDVKRLSLAQKVADLFDQYQIYRPEMIGDWNESAGDFEDYSGWQKYLWMKTKEILGSNMPDKTAMGVQIIDALKKPETRQKLVSKIPNVHVFGLSIITAYHVQIFHELSKTIDVTFFLLNPAPSVYWFEDKSEKQIAIWRKKSKLKVSDADLRSNGNPLLIGWGKVLQDTFNMFFESDVFLNEYDDLQSKEPAPDTLLHKIQNDIFNNSEAEGRNKIDERDLNDGSITISACYTTAREVEVLYNYLVHLIDQRKEVLAARDIVVMVSNIEAYAPYIKAIFKSAPYQFAFAIADDNFTISDNIFSALQSALNLSEDNFKAEDVLQLLDSNFIRTRFSITDLELTRKAVDKANIRFGIDGRAEDETIYVSWKNGIRRIMYGICMSGEDEYFADGYNTIPLDIAEGEDSFELIRFCHFAEVLISTIEERRQPRTISGWAEYIEQVLDKLICQSENNSEEDYQILLQNLERIYVLDEVVTDKISFDVFKHSFVNSLAAETRSGAFASGGITFCSLIPMRSIPFKVVALLGMNFDKFPRKETRVSFNLMEQDARKGDRNVKENDKHLFLETLLSAQKYFYISYLGRSSKDNTVLPPSVLVDELIDYIQNGLEGEKIEARQSLVVTHPLHGFSRRYLEGNKSLYNYLDQPDVSGNRTSVSIETVPEGLSFEEVSIETFIAFFKNPFKAYYNSVLRVRYEQDNVLLPENEVFELDGLQLWQTKQDLLFTGNEDLEAYRNRGVATGSLPLKNMANLVLTNTEADVLPVKQLVKHVVGEAAGETMHIELEVGSSTLKGSLNRIYDGKLVVISLSKNESKYLLEAWIKYLVAIAAGNPLDLNYVSALKNRVFQVEERHRSKKSALKALEKLMQLYKRGHEEIMMFYPDFNKSPTDIMSMTAGKFTAMVKKYSESEGCDIYFKKEYSFGFFSNDNVFDDYVENSNEVFAEAKELFDAYYSKM